MFSGYLLHILALGCVFILDIFNPGQAHVLPKGFHLSNSCQPRCNSGKTCVVYRTQAGIAKSICIIIDPHKSVLDGSFIITSQNVDDSPETSMAANKGTDGGQRTNRVFGTLIKQLPDTGLETVKVVNRNIEKPRQTVIDRMTAISNSLKLNLQNEHGSLGKRPKLFSPNNSNRIVKSFPQIQHMSSTVKPKTGNKKAKFLGLTLVRTADGGVIFRRVNKAEERKSDQGLKSRASPLIKDTNARPLTTLKNASSGIDKAINRSTSPHHPQENAVKADFVEKTACKPCDPDHACPANQYCYLSLDCGWQICQYL